MISLDIAYAVLTLILIVLGLAVIFGMLRVINMAHGETVILGCYCVYLTSQYELSFITGVLLAMSVTAGLGALIYWFIIKRIRQRLLDTILATWGISIVLKQLLAIAFGAGGKNVGVPLEGQINLFDFTYPLYRLVVMGVVIIAVLLIYGLFFKTRFGIKARAVMSNPILSSCIGINQEKLQISSFMIGSAIAGLAGAMIAPLISISPLIGQDYLIPSFLSVLLGGLGSILAPILGAGIVSITESSMAIIYDPVVAQIAMLVIAVVLLKLFPNGLINRKK